MRPIIGIALLLALGGCAQDGVATSAVISANNAAPGRGATTVHIIFPCQVSDYLLPGLKGDMNIVVDEKKTGVITSCQHRSLTVASGKHTIRLANQGFDFGDIFGGVTFNLPANAHFYLRAQGDGHTNWFLYETDAALGKKMMAELDSGKK